MATIIRTNSTPDTTNSADKMPRPGAAKRAATGATEGGETLKLPPFDVYRLFHSLVSIGRTGTLDKFRDDDKDAVLEAHYHAENDGDSASNSLKEYETQLDVIAGFFNSYDIVEEAYKLPEETANEIGYLKEFDAGDFARALNALSLDIPKEASGLAVIIAGRFPVLKPFLEYLAIS